MIKVLYDHQMFSLQQYGGISRYFANLYHAFKEGYDIDPSVSLLYSKNHYLSDVKTPLPSFIGELVASKKSRLYKWNKLYNHGQIKKNNYDLLHPTYYDPYFLKNLRKPYVLTVHDMIYEMYPEYFEAEDKFVKHKRNLIEKADHLIAISESTKRDLQKFYGIADKQITVVHHGFYPETTSAKPEGFGMSDYLLFVGDRSAYKNFEPFVRAIEPLLSTNRSLQLICTGGGRFKPDEESFLQQLGISKQVHQISASNAELNYLYQHAKLFVFPSLYEGFGFPLLEAFSNNCPVAASNTSSFKEVGGDAVAYFNPTDQQEILNAVTTLLQQTELAEKLKAQGRRQLNNFLMKDCVQKTAAVYHKVIGR